MKPEDVFEGKFDWSAFLQPFLWNSGVVVSKLHPIFGLRLAALFIELESIGMARKGSGGTYQFYSGVRTREHQKALWEQICLRDKRCEMVADYRTNRGPDSEGIVRFGSNHMAQNYGPVWPVELGHAVDISNGRVANGMDSAQLKEAWRPLHELLPRYGLVYPLDGTFGNPYEPWHIEANPRASGWVPGPWPKRPGVHRPIARGYYGGDCKIAQAQCATKLGLTLTQPGQPRVSGDVLNDGIIGPVGVALIEDTQGVIKRSATGVWVEADQVRFEALVGAGPVDPPVDPPAPKPPSSTVTVERSVLEQSERYLALVLSNVREALK